MYKLYIKNSTSILEETLKENNIKNYKIYYNKYGKPYIKGIYFNISHTNNLSACVISDNEVGIDIEQITYNEKVARKILTKNELDNLYLCSNKAEMFTIYWTMKESYVKLLGIGLEYGLKNVDTEKLKNKIIVRKYNNYIVALALER